MGGQRVRVVQGSSLARGSTMIGAGRTDRACGITMDWNCTGAVVRERGGEVELEDGPHGAGADPARWVAPEAGAVTPPAAPVAPAIDLMDAGDPERVTPPVPMRPMTLSDILDGSFAVIKRRPRVVLTIAAIVLVPVQLLQAYASRASIAGMGALVVLRDPTTFASSSQARFGVVDFVLSILAMLAASLALFFLGAALTHLVTAWYTGTDPTAGDALRVAFRRAGPLIGAWALLLPAKFVAAIPCYLGLIFIVPLFSLTAPVIVAEGLGPVEAAKRSWQLVSRRLWPCIGIVLLATLVQYTLTRVLMVVPTLLAGALPSPFNWITVAVVSSLVSMITASALVAASVLLYVDLRIRTEGLDLELDLVDAFPATV